MGIIELTKAIPLYQLPFEVDIGWAEFEEAVGSVRKGCDGNGLRRGDAEGWKGCVDGLVWCRGGREPIIVFMLCVYGFLGAVRRRYRLRDVQTAHTGKAAKYALKRRLGRQGLCGGTQTGPKSPQWPRPRGTTERRAIR